VQQGHQDELIEEKPKSKQPKKRKNPDPEDEEEEEPMFKQQKVEENVGRKKPVFKSQCSGM